MVDKNVTYKTATFLSHVHTSVKPQQKSPHKDITSIKSL